MERSWIARGIEASDRMRRHFALTGKTRSGQLLWTEDELRLLRQLYPMPYAEIAKRLPGRTPGAIRKKAGHMGLSPKVHVWTGAEIKTLRRVYTTGSTADIKAAFPGLRMRQITAIANFYKIYRPRKPYLPTGIRVIDQIRQRAFEIGYSMRDIDELARTKQYFFSGSWRYNLDYKAIGRAITALDGEVVAVWNDS